MKKLIIILLCILFTCSSAVFSKEKDTTLTPLAKNIVYIEAAVFDDDNTVSYFISINYEKIIDKYLSIRIGYGYSEYGDQCYGSDCYYSKYHGTLVMLNFHSMGNNKLNMGCGICYMNNFDNIEEYKVLPAFCISYRYQPLNDHMYFSAGFTYAFSGGGISLSIGYIFN